VSHPPKGAPTRPLRPANNNNAPVPAAPPGRVALARFGILAIFAANPKLAPDWQSDTPLHRRFDNKEVHSPCCCGDDDAPDFVPSLPFLSSEDDEEIAKSDYRYCILKNHFIALGQAT
jgi:hypothetical protein